MSRFAVLTCFALALCIASSASAQIPGARFFLPDGTFLDTLSIAPADTEMIFSLYLASTGTAKTHFDSISVLATHPDAYHLEIRKLNGSNVQLPDSLRPGERWDISLSIKSWLLASGDTCRIAFNARSVTPFSFVVRMVSPSRVIRVEGSEVEFIRSPSQLTILSPSVTCLQIYDVGGRVLKTSTIPEISLQEFGHGVFLARVLFEDETERVLKFSR